MQRPRAHPPLLIGYLSLAAAVLGRLIDPDLPRDFLEGVFDGVGVATPYGYLPARHAGTLRPSWRTRPVPKMVDVWRNAK